MPRSKPGASKSRPLWAAHTRIGNVWEYPPRARHQLKPPWTSDLSAFWNEKILFVYWKFSDIYCRERFDTGWRAAVLQDLYPEEWIVPNKLFLTRRQGFRKIKPHNKKQEIPKQSLIVLTFFYRKSFLLQFLQSPATCSIREQSNFTNLVIQG